jgi:hypothetical protein
MNKYYNDNKYENEYDNDNDNNDDNLLLNIENIPKYIINLYESNKNKINIIKNYLINIIEEYDIDRQITEYKEKLNNIYIDVFEPFFEYDCPLEIFDINRNNLSFNFIEWLYDNSEFGNDLTYIENIYNILLSE